MLLQISTLIHVALNFYSPSTAALIYWVWIYTLHKHTIKQTFIMLWSLWHTGNNTINNVALHSELCCLFCLCCCFKSNSYNHLFIFFTFLFLCVCRCLCVCVCVCELLSGHAVLPLWLQNSLLWLENQYLTQTHTHSRTHMPASLNELIFDSSSQRLRPTQTGLSLSLHS